MPLAKEVYVRYYKQQQHGGSLPVFRGGRHDQDGAGLGSILAGIFRRVAPIALRHVAPIAARGISSFASNTLRAHQQGVPLGEAAKAAILPALGDAARSLMRAPQTGGKRKRASRKRSLAVSVSGGTNAMLGGGVLPAKRRKRTPSKKRQVGSGKRKRRQTGAGKRRKTAKKGGQKGGKKRAYKKKTQRGSGRSAPNKKRRTASAKKRVAACEPEQFRF